ncbi:MAG: hypothetical protein WEC00_11235 [Dongiaceae bacterium]
MKKFAGSLAVGFTVGALLVGASSIESHYAFAADYIQLAAGDTNQAGALPDTTVPRNEYETQMQAVMDERSTEVRSLRDSETTVTEDALAAVESSWQVVEESWAETQAAADEEWEAARETMIEAWDDFEATWNDTFNDETDSSQM